MKRLTLAVVSVMVCALLVIGSAGNAQQTRSANTPPSAVPSTSGAPNCTIVIGSPTAMLQTSVGERMNTTGVINITQAPKQQMTIQVQVKNARSNTPYGIWLVDHGSMLKLGRTGQSDSHGSVILNWTGNAMLTNYEDLAVYQVPKTTDLPRSGAIRVLSIPVNRIVSSRGAGAGAGSKPAAAVKQPLPAQKKAVVVPYGKPPVSKK